MLQSRHGRSGALINWISQWRRFANLTFTDPLSIERDRWFLWVTPLLAVGIAVYFASPIEPTWAITASPLAVFLVLRLSFGTRERLSLLANVLIIVAVGFGAAKVRTELVRAPVLVAPIRNAVVTGWVERLELRADQSQRITLLVIKIKGLQPRWVPRRVRIRLRKAATELKTGDAIRITARLAGPPPPALPRGYDFARAAYFMGIGGVGFALAKPTVVETGQSAPMLFRLSVRLQHLRRVIGSRIETALPGEVGIMANALMTGERSGISRETNDLYRDAGIFHILSISGLHMAIMGGAVFFGLRFLLAMWPGIALRYPIKKWAALAAAISTFGYLLISGGAHPTVRSFIMILIMFLAILLDRPAIALRNVALAALIILLVLPESLFNAGFQLSFAAVAALVAAYEGHRARARRRRRQGFDTEVSGPVTRGVRSVWLFMAGTIATTVIAGLATAPFAAFHFHTSQQYSVLTNMLVIPVSNLIVMPAALAAFIVMPFGLEAWPLGLMGAGIEIMTWSARQVTALPGAVSAVPTFPAIALQLMVVGGLWFFIWRRPWRWLGVVAALVGLYLSTVGVYPSALIGKNGELVALRDRSGRLAALKARYGTYEFSRWLEADGDVRMPDAAWSRKPFRCDLEGCTGLVGRHRIAMPQSPAALSDDCQRADLIVISFPKPKGCATAAIVLDYAVLHRYGTHAVFIEPDGSMRIETVEQFRGWRPWTMAEREQSRVLQRTERRQRANARSKPDGTASVASAKYARPEIEEEGHPLYWSR